MPAEAIPKTRLTTGRGSLCALAILAVPPTVARERPKMTAEMALR